MLKLETKNQNFFYVFDSVAEVKGFVKEDFVGKQIAGGREEWIGRAFRDAADFQRALDEAWQKGIETMNLFVEKLEKANLPQIKDLKTRKVFNSSEGEIDMDRLLAGNPNHYVKMVTEKGEGTPEVTIVIDTCGAGSRTAENLLWRGAGAIALVKMLEQQGYRTEIWAIAGATCFEDYPNRGIVPTLLMKRPGDP